jgi:GGDEF domain-containing protein
MGLATSRTVPVANNSYFAGLYADERTCTSSLPGERPPQLASPPDAQALFLVGDKMKRAARQHQLAVALLVLAVPDLPELENIFGPTAASEAARAVLRELSRSTRGRGFAVRTARDTFALLVPGVTGGWLKRALRRRLGDAWCVEFNLGREEMVLVADVQSCTVEDRDSIEKTYLVLRSVMESRRHMDQIQQHCVRQQEPHSTRADLPFAASQPDAPMRSRAASYATIPATILMPIGRH